MEYGYKESASRGGSRTKSPMRYNNTVEKLPAAKTGSSIEVSGKKGMDYSYSMPQNKKNK